MKLDRHTVISADCHAGAPLPEGGYRAYVDLSHRDAYDTFLVEQQRRFDEQVQRLFGDEVKAELDTEEAVVKGGKSGAWNPSRRVQELEADGIVADVIFPDVSQNNAAPFFAASGPSAPGADWALQAVGARAYNRWLAEFCATNPGRHAGIALITIHDIEESVKEIRDAQRTGLRGILLPAGVGELPFYNHPRYELIWATCEELGLPIHTHVGTATPDYGDLPGAGALFASESAWFSHRPFWFLVWGGVFERHPGLTMVFAEQGADWVPDVLRRLDRIYNGLFRHEQARLPLPPSAYWERQCYVQAMFRDRREADMRHEIGVHKLFWGSDYPHYEGSWPNSRRLLHNALEAAPEPELRAILAANAAKVYRFDLGQLDAIAARVGPYVSEI
jgi:predicted TIM-barrel fold metal-dependent hydrolase